MKMKYAIVTNPVAGKMSVDRKRTLLAGPAEILNAEICGLDTSTVEDFCQCARELSSRCDIVVVAGGDGTFSDVLNAIDTTKIAIAFLPLGTGNAMQHALNYQGSLQDIAGRIKKGDIHEYDLINCDDRQKAFMVSLGIDGKVIPAE